MEPAHVEVDLGFFPLMWILYFVSPWLAVDGQSARSAWGKHQLTLPAGRHRFEAWFPYIFRSQTCLGAIDLDLAPGASYRIRYRPAWLVFLPGKMTVQQQPLLAPAIAKQLPPS
jgi:hypothetical protein